MLIQDRGITGNIDAALDSLKGSVRSLMELFNFTYVWDKESEETWRSNIVRLNEVIEANPGMQDEIKDIVKRHSQSQA